MSEQQVQGFQVIEVEDPIHRIRAGDPGAGLEQQPRAVQAFQRVLERLALVGIRTGPEQ